MIAISILCLVLASLGSQPVPEGQEKSTVDLEVHLSTTKEQFEVGETIELKVEIWNRGKRPVYIGQEIARYLDWIHTLNLIVEDTDGNLSPSVAFPPPFVTAPDKRQSFSEALSTWWVAIPPNHFYGTLIYLDGAAFNFLTRPGRYRIRGKYKSHGMSHQTQYNPLVAFPDEVSKLPYSAWIGEVETNALWIEIVSTKR